MINKIFFLFVWILPVLAQNSANTCSADDKTCQAVQIEDQVDEHNCEDQHKDCEYWARHGECDANPLYMKDKCRRSCKVCSADKA